MTSFCSSAPPFHSLILPSSSNPKRSSPSSLWISRFPPTPSSNFLILSLRMTQLRTLKTSDETNDPALLCKPSIASMDAADRLVSKGGFSGFADFGDQGIEGPESWRGGDSRWVDWEDRILEDTVPLVGFVRMIIHSGK